MRGIAVVQTVRLVLLVAALPALLSHLGIARRAAAGADDGF